MNKLTKVYSDKIYDEEDGWYKCIESLPEFNGNILGVYYDWEQKDDGVFYQTVTEKIINVIKYTDEVVYYHERKKIKAPYCWKYIYTKEL